MQQRGSTATMDTEESDNNSSMTPSSRASRSNSKLKVLVRSHAMREETSPPREPSPNPQQPPLHSPCITLIPSPEIVVLSPSLLSPSPQCLSPTSTSTLVPSSPNNSRCSSNTCAYVDIGSPVERIQLNCGEEENTSGYVTPSPKVVNKNVSKSTSHNFKKKNSCECQNQNCPKCAKNQERNNNNSMTNGNNNITASSNTLTVSRANSKGKLRQQSSSLGSFESSLNSPCLSRDNSSELYTDTTGVDLEQFIPETLNRNAKDRALMLRIEQELVHLAKDKSKTHFKFPPMSSYQRMLVHRCAAYFGMDHNLEQAGKSVVVNKTKNTRIPDVEFKEHIKDDIIFSEEPRRSILKRDSNSIDDYRSFGSESRRSKSFEEREEEYEKARKRIFNREMRDESSEGYAWSEAPWSSTESDYATRYRLQMPEMHYRHSGKLVKGHSEETGETLRPCVAKSYSFGGYGGSMSVLTRGDSVISTHSAGPRFLTKQDSGASSVSWRLSPSSSGYKSQSQLSGSVTPSPTSTPHLASDLPSSCGDDQHEIDCMEKIDDNHLLWAVTDMQNVPKGSVIINPQTGQPLKNEDGTLYHYDPENLPSTFSQAPPKPLPPPPQKPYTQYQQTPGKSQTMQSSPSKKSNVTNSSTSPSLPSQMPAPISEEQKNFSYVQADQPQYPAYHTTYSSPPAVPEPATVYQQPCVVYQSPYGFYMPQPYDGRVEIPSSVTVSEVGGSTYYLPEGSAPPPAQPVTYQPTPPNQYWNQPVTYYPNNSQTVGGTPPRYPSVPVQNPAHPAYISPGYPPPPNYIASSPHPVPPVPQDIQPVYPNQPVQVVYQNPPPPPTSVYYQNPPPLIYNQQPVYQSTAPIYPHQLTSQPVLHQPNMPAYPQGTPTPNGCPGAGPHVSVVGPDQQTLYNLAQSIQHMNLGGSAPGPSFLQNKIPPPHYDYRQRPVNNGVKGKPIKYLFMGSSQSSTGTNSPAGTVITSYCPQNTGMYRPASETPPQQFPPFPPNFPPPAVLKQGTNVRVNTPVTAKNSRSPTPASDVTHLDRQKMALPPSVHPGMPYMVSGADPRSPSGRGQPNVYRPPLAQMNTKPTTNQGSDNRNKNRKPKTNKQTGLPPSGK